MEQPLDFSKSTTTVNSMKTPPFAVKKPVQRFSNSKSLKSFNKDYHVNNSENSDENTSRSSASSPDSIANEQAALNTGHNTLSQQALLMLAAVSNPNLAKMNFNAQQLINGSSGDLNSKLISQLNTFNGQSTPTSMNNGGSFLLSPQNLNSSAHAAAALAVSNMMNQQQVNHQFGNSFANLTTQSNPTQGNKAQSKSNQTKASSKSNAHKAVSRKSMIMAKQQEDEQKVVMNQSISSTKFGILSNSQNSNILQIDTESESNSPLLNSSLQISISSNLSGEENSLYNDLFSQDDGSPRSQRRRGNPIPESLKDDSYWVRRRKNNEAAKKSRDAKRAKDLVTAKRAVLLENENSQLKMQLNQIRSENLILRSFLGDDVFYDDGQRQQIDELISIGRKVDPDKVRTFAQEFVKIFGLHPVERMES